MRRENATGAPDRDGKVLANRLTTDRRELVPVALRGAPTVDARKLGYRIVRYYRG